MELNKVQVFAIQIIYVLVCVFLPEVICYFETGKFLMQYNYVSEVPRHIIIVANAIMIVPIIVLLLYKLFKSRKGEI